VGLGRVDVVFQHHANCFQTRFGHLVDERFEFVTASHNGRSIAPSLARYHLLTATEMRVLLA
jgi:hypothetical protein